MGKWGMILLAIWLILSGLMLVLHIHISSSGLVLALLALAAGVLILISQWPLRLSKNLGMMLLAVWLILTGAMTLFTFSFANSGLVLGLLAAITGVFLLLKR